MSSEWITGSGYEAAARRHQSRSLCQFVSQSNASVHVRASADPAVQDSTPAAADELEVQPGVRMSLLSHPLHLWHRALHVVFPYGQADRDLDVSQSSQHLGDGLLLVLILLPPLWTVKREKSVSNLFTWRTETLYCSMCF